MPSRCVFVLHKHIQLFTGHSGLFPAPLACLQISFSDTEAYSSLTSFLLFWGSSPGFMETITVSVTELHAQAEMVSTPEFEKLKSEGIKLCLH